MNPDDFNAEDLHQRTSEIGADKLKERLLARFRPEQVARLGSMLIIFPNLSKAAFQKLIRLKLEEVTRWFQAHLKFRIEFHPSIVTLIFTEGVVPSQGVRPVLSTITEMIESRAPGWLVRSMTAGHSSIIVSFEANSCELVVESSGEQMARETITLREARLPKIKIPTWVRSRIAFHGAGHAVVAIVNEKRLPLKILAGSMAWHRGGPRVIFDHPAICTFEHGLDRLEILLAGRVAEEILFGKLQVSSGCELDLGQATALARKMICEWGMGTHLSVSTDDPMRPFNARMFKRADEQVEKWLKAAYANAVDTLKRQRPLLDALGAALLKSERLTSAGIGAVVAKHYVGPKSVVNEVLSPIEAKGDDPAVPKLKGRRLSA